MTVEAAHPGASARLELDARVLAWMREGELEPDEARFDSLARAIFDFQRGHCPAYSRFCALRGVDGPVDHWSAIPAVPTGAFKELALRCFPAERTTKTFRTSGTSTERRGELHLDTLALYEASLLPTFRAYVFPDLEPGARADIQVLAPSATESPDSSLSHMFARVLAELASPASGFAMHAGQLDCEAILAAADRAADTARPLALCGTSFAFVHLLEQTNRRIALPDGSRIMETGGFKGRSREIAREDLYAALSHRLGIPATRIVNQYGMTELGSQFYDSVLRAPVEPRRKLGPPWARVRILDPETGSEARRGEPGIIVVHDLANTGSVACIETADLGIRLPAGEGFQVLGRDPGAEDRGCSVAADTMLEEAR